VHEWSLAVALVGEAEAQARSRGAVRVHEVTVTVGTLTGIVPDLLARAYEVARQGSLLDGVPLRIIVEECRAFCPACGEEKRVEDILPICPDCGGTGLDIVKGEGIALTQMDLEVDHV